MTRSLTLILSLALVTASGCTDPDNPPPEDPGTVRTEEESSFAMGDATQTLCADGSGELCATFPTDMAGHAPGIGYIPNTNAGGAEESFSQTFVDYFGWQAFVALNWPLDADGQPSATETITSDVTSPRVWSSFQTKDEVFNLGAGGGCQVPPGNLSLYRTAKSDTDNFIEAGTSFPLIDRYGNYAVYDIRVSPREVEYLQANGLTTKAGQEAFGQTYDFPAGSGSEVGAMEIKSSWRVMTDSDDLDAFYTTGATIAVPPDGSATGEQLCLDVTVGLVGMHIMQKFSNPGEFSTFWSWATFEHVSNAPVADNAPVSLVNEASSLDALTPPSCTLSPDTADATPYSFYNPACTTSSGASCAVNDPPALPAQGTFLWAASQPFASDYMTQGADGLYGTQVARCFDIYDSAVQTTGAFQAALGDGPWSQYMLVGAQWASASSTGSGPLTSLVPFAAPIYLTNTTMETYIQVDSVQAAGFDKGSCIACHNVATDAANNNSNLSFLPGSAQ